MIGTHLKASRKRRLGPWLRNKILDPHGGVDKDYALVVHTVDGDGARGNDASRQSRSNVF